MGNRTLLLIVAVCAIPSTFSQSIPTFSLTVAAKDRKVEVTYKDIKYTENDAILLTSKEVSECKFEKQWSCNNGSAQILYAFQPSSNSSYFKTNVTYKYTNGSEFNKSSRCHSVWAVYLNSSGRIVASTCLMVHPRWLNNLLPNIGFRRFRDLIIPGTHDSASYKEGFEIPQIELPVTRYSLTQDDTILGQLYQGARYLDIRPSFYKNLPNKWYVNHGITIQQTLDNVMDQVKKFVNETGEPVIFGLKEFPVGFNTIDIHRNLVQYMESYFGNYIFKPKDMDEPWKFKLNDILGGPQQAKVILAYDNQQIALEYQSLLFQAVRQNWGNVRKWKDLENYLRMVSQYDIDRLSNIPVADMAELTPTELDVVLDRLGGLRKMADDVNLNLCDLYENELYSNANIIAVDFIKGTRITEIAIFYNRLMWRF